MQTIRLDGVVGWDIYASDIAAKIEGEDHVKLIINSGGGDILEGFSIYNLLNDFSGQLDVHVDLAASMASVIAMAGDNIYMKENSSIMMIHRPWGAMGGNSEDLRGHADTLDQLEDMLLNIYAEKTGGDRDEIMKMLADETYLSASQALDHGFISKIEKGKADMAAVAIAGLKASNKVDMNTIKFAAKMQDVQSSKPPVKKLFDNCNSLQEIEKTIRKNFNISQNEATAIVASVKKIGLGDQDQKPNLDIFQNYEFKNL